MPFNGALESDEPGLEKWIQLIVEAMPNAMVMVDGELRIKLLNQGAETLFGYRREELVGERVEILIPARFWGDHAAHVRSFMEQPRARAMGLGRELVGRHKDGTEVGVEIALTPISTEDGLFTLASMIDITYRKRAERRFQLAVEAAPNAMLMVDRERKITLANRTAEEVFGYTRDELLGLTLESLLPERYRGRHPAQVSNFFANPTARSMGVGRDLFGRRKDGTEVPVEIRLNPIETSDGLFTLASVVDTSERKRAEARLRMVVEAAPNAIVMIDQDGVIWLVNRKAEELFSYDRTELVGRQVEMLVPERYRERHADHVAAFFTEPKARAMGAGRELFGRRKDGTEMPIEIGLNPVHAPDGRFTLASIIDITERRHYEDELRRSNEELAQFAYVASHDLQEPLRTVASFTELLSQRYKGKLDEKADLYIHYAVDGAKRMQRLISDLLLYSRVGSQGNPFVEVSTATVLERVLELLANQIRDAGGTVEAGPMPEVLADEGQLDQLFQNLIGNAIKFRGETPPVVRIDARMQNDRWLFSVRDNGIGIPKPDTERVFQMFQRLHERNLYEGSGIGLSIVKKIVERHGGTISFESEPGQGTTFLFTLPAMVKGTS